MNKLGKACTPFLFVIDYKMEKSFIIPLQEIDNTVLCYEINGARNFEPLAQSLSNPFLFTKHPVSKDIYQRGFDIVMKNLRLGNSFLTNLTFTTSIHSDLCLRDFFIKSKAPYKLWINEKFSVYSPEKFVTIQDNIIRSFPMKGTIDASLENAEQTILHDEKEMAEHYTIVDLVRNDLSLVAKKVRVERFRYLDTINTNQKTLLQVSSEIAGNLESDWNNEIGTIFAQLLPAGSITGAPKKKTIDIIQEAENEPRGYYTGVFGVFDGRNLESAVMIRFIEQRDDALFYHSGGGITVNSICEHEYQEMIEKVYVPIN